MLERDEKSPALGVELREFARGEGSKCGARIGKFGELALRSPHPGQPVKGFADVGILEPGGRELLGDALAVEGDVSLLAVLEQVNKDVEHFFGFLF
jgi:hypothetical protein